MHVVAPVVKIISYCLTLSLNFYQIRQGVVTSGLLFTFWFFQTVCGGITFRSVLLTDYVSGNDRILPFTNYTIQYPFIVAMFFLNCFADAKPNFVNADGTYSALFTLLFKRKSIPIRNRNYLKFSRLFRNFQIFSKFNIERFYRQAVASEK